MGKFKDDQSGFSTLEAVLVIIVTAIIGGTGWYVYNANTKTNKIYNSANQASNATDATKADTYAGWKTYTASLQPVSFRYPADWRVSDDVNKPVKEADNESISLWSPTRKFDGKEYQFFFTFQIHSPEPSLGDASPIYSSTRLTNAKFPQPLYVLFEESGAPAGEPHAGEIEAVTVSTKHLEAGDYGSNGGTILTATAGQQIDVGGSYSYTSNGQSYAGYFSPKAFASLKEVEQAQQIFKSLTQK